MIRRTAVLLACVAALGPACTRDAPPERGPRYLTIGADALGTAAVVGGLHDAHLRVLATGDEVAVIAFDAEDLEPLAAQMHAQHARCGGFVVHATLAEALAAQAEIAAQAQVRPAPPVDYTLARPEVVAAVLPTLDPARILGTIRSLSAMKNRYYTSETGAAASVWLRDRWRSFTSRRDVTVELLDHGFPQRSVLLRIPGTTRPDEVVVIGGHLDSIAVGGKGSTAPGADDDASGIATLTEVARALLAADVRPARTIEIIAYAAEEIGLRGSQAVVKDHQARGIQVIGALQLDMTNFQGSEKAIWLMKDFTSAAQNAFLIELIDTYVGATWGLDACGYACSDHASWYRAGVPASMPFEARMKDRNKVIHTARDTLETSGDNAAHALTFARLAAAYAIELGRFALPVRTAAR